MRRKKTCALGYLAIAASAAGSDQLFAGKSHQDLYTPYYSGTCKGESGDVYLNEALFVQNPIVKIRTGSGFALLRFIRDELEIRDFDGDGKLLDSHKIDVQNEVLRFNKTLKDIDIEPAFVWVQNGLGVYWRETYQHRPYLHGVFRIAGNSLENLCQGSGGFVTNE